MTTHVGLIGLGAMGSGMARSLRRAGYLVHVYDVRPEGPVGEGADAVVVALKSGNFGTDDFFSKAFTMLA